MEWSILFLGTVGAGKTQAIRSVSDISMVDTDVAATDEVRALKKTTTVAMDMGVIRLDDNDKVVVYGAPGQDRFDFMWEILWEQSKGLVLLLDHRRPEVLTDLGQYVRKIRELNLTQPKPLVVGVTHIDETTNASLQMYRDFLSVHAQDLGGSTVPVMSCDAREKQQVRVLLLALTAMMDFMFRFPKRAKA